VTAVQEVNLIEMAEHLAQSVNTRSIPTLALFYGCRETARQSGGLGVTPVTR
jgi:hypothetical protein